MCLFPFQHHILQLSIPVFIDPRVFFKRIQDDLALHDPGFFRIRPHVIRPVPHADILFHRLPVEKYPRDIRPFRLIDDDRRNGAVHHIHTDDIVRTGDEIIHLVVLVGLAVFSVRNIQDDLFACLALHLFRNPLQVIA